MNKQIKILKDYINFNLPKCPVITDSDTKVYVDAKSIISYETLSETYDMSDRDSDKLHYLVQRFNQSHNFKIDWNWDGRGTVIIFFINK